MNNILVIGAGRSATELINYLLERAGGNDWKVFVADSNVEVARKKVGGHIRGEVVEFDVLNNALRKKWIRKADIIISLLPPGLHLHVAKDCVALKKNLVTASYVSDEIYALSEEAEKSGVILMGEMGLDPGIDHMSAMQKINQIKGQGGRMEAFRSYSGGLIAPESDNNPWHYKVTWNPMNVVLAGKGTAQFIQDGKYCYIPYNRVFDELEDIDVPELGKFEAYPNRDSLFYRNSYRLGDIPTLIRGTLRYPGFCEAWKSFVKLGWTDDSYPIINSYQLTYREVVEAYLGRPTEADRSKSIKTRLAEFLEIPEDSEVMKKLEWLGVLSDQKIRLKDVSPAETLKDLIEEKWSLEKGDKDLIIMQHYFDYEKNGQKFRVKSSMNLKGENPQKTAMAKLVGYPLGIFAKLILQNKIEARGVQIPIISEVYNPVLEELESLGVVFKEYESTLS